MESSRILMFANAIGDPKENGPRLVDSLIVTINADGVPVVTGTATAIAQF